MRGPALAALVILVVLAGGTGWLVFRLADMSSEPFAAVAPEGARRVLFLGYGGGKHPGAYLSDSMVLLIEDGAKQAEVAIPRDLWVQIPPGSGRYAKINEALEDGFGSGGLAAGADLASRKVEDVTGLPVTGWVAADFEGFRAVIDALGGIDIDVPRAFSARYPVNDNPAVDPGWKTVHFQAGPQHMDGERALEYARARYASDPREATDFARQARQQALIAAVWRRAASLEGMAHLLPMIDAASGAVRTNLPLIEIAGMLTRFQPNHVKHIALSPVLMDGQSADGEQILLPRGGDYAQIARYIRDQLA